MSAIEEDAIHLILENAALRFETASAAVRAGACWTASEGPPLAALERLAWAADLIVVTRGSPAALKSLVVGGGRPVLLTPATATRARFSRVLVRWDGSAACRRALAGALPFLARADRIDIAPDRRNRTPSGRRALHDLEEGLALRGVEVRTTTDGRGGRLACDAHLLEHGADLVVTSAWPAPPNRPLFARSLEPHLHEIDSCVLLSH